ncbi:MAG: GIY-YIG nuclease family protein [Syntrophomonadaceae bacterium]|nr:GIY-YIG nuclease family protein [Syntrophomonadaceae bacterium]
MLWNSVTTENKRGGKSVAWVYILKCGDGSYYTGYALDPAKRLAEHKAGIASRYTRSHLPVKMVYTEECADKSAALKRERTIKRLTRAQKEELIRGFSPEGEPDKRVGQE